LNVTININPVFREANESKARYLNLYGGAGSGKSHFTAQKVLIRILNGKKQRILCTRKVARTIRNSQFRLLKDLIHEYELSKLFKVNEVEMQVKCVNGNEVLSVGMDDPEKIKSITGLTGIWAEEATELEEQDFNQLNLRLRGKTAEYKQFILTYNPVYVGHWLNKIKLKDCYKLKTTYLDNPHIDEEYKKVLDELKYTDENYYNIYALGNWGMIRNAERAYFAFSRSKNVGTFDGSVLEFIISYDFNINPMCAVLYFFGNQKYFQVKEWRIDNSNTEEISELICQHLQSYGITQSVIVTGDASGRAKGTKGHMSDYEIIQSVFSRYRIPFHLQIPEANPPVRDRINYVNKMFQTERLTISEECQYSIQDRELVVWKKGSEAFKIDKSNPDLTHLSDAADYGLWNTQALLQEDNYKKQFALGGARKWQ